MAQQNPPGNAPAIAPVAGPAAQTAAAPTAPAAAAQGTATSQDNKDGGQPAAAQQQGGPVAGPTENVTLTPTAQEELEKKKLEEEKKLQEQIDQLMQQIDETKAQLEQAQQSRDKNRVAALTNQLHDLEGQLGALIDQPAVQQANPAGHGGGGGTPNLIPPPAGGMGGMGGGGFNPYAFGNMGGARGAGGGLNQGNFAPAANPNVQIPDYGKGANKAQIGEMLDAASKKYGIPPNILKAVAWQESGWNSKALSFDGQHGKGVMQIDDRFHDFARTPDVFDPAKNIDYGAKYLAGLYAKSGSWSGALKSYNGGSDYPPKVLALAQQQPWARQGLA